VITIIKDKTKVCWQENLMTFGASMFGYKRIIIPVYFKAVPEIEVVRLLPVLNSTVYIFLPF